MARSSRTTTTTPKPAPDSPEGVAMAKSPIDRTSADLRVCLAGGLMTQAEVDGVKAARRKAAGAKAVATKRAAGTLVDAARKATQTKRDAGTLQLAGQKAAATLKRNKAAAKAATKVAAKA